MLTREFNGSQVSATCENTNVGVILKLYVDGALRDESHATFHLFEWKWKVVCMANVRGKTVTIKGRHRTPFEAMKYLFLFGGDMRYNIFDEAGNVI